MTLEKVLYPTRVHITGGWKKVLMIHPLLRIVFISLLAAQATPNTVLAQVKAVPPLSGVIGKVQSVTDSSIDVQTGSGVVHVEITRPSTWIIIYGSLGSNAGEGTVCRRMDS